MQRNKGESKKVNYINKERSQMNYFYNNRIIPLVRHTRRIDLY
jgi:hypothetical protein